MASSSISIEYETSTAIINSTSTDATSLPSGQLGPGGRGNTYGVGSGKRYRSKHRRDWDTPAHSDLPSCYAMVARKAAREKLVRVLSLHISAGRLNGGLRPVDLRWADGPGIIRFLIVCEDQMRSGCCWHDAAPDTSPPPAHEAIVASSVWAKRLRQIAPWRSRSQDPEGAIEDATIIHPGHAARLVR